MKPCSTGADLDLLAGEWHFGAAPRRLRTLLGSCVALAIWHPRLRVAGMCHFVLPERQQRGHSRLDARFGDEAVAMLVAACAAAGTAPRDYVAHLCGGANALGAPGAGRPPIGEMNAARGRMLAADHGFALHGSDLGGRMPRMVTLRLADGAFEVRHGPAHHPTTGARP